MFCLSCSTSLPEDALFCVKCGRLVPKGNGESPSKASEQTLALAFSSSDPYNPRPSTSYGPLPLEGDMLQNPYGPLIPPPPPPPRRFFSGFLKGLLIGILVIVLLGGGLGGWLFFKQGVFSPSAPHSVRTRYNRVPTATPQPTVQSTAAHTTSQSLPGAWTQCAVETATCTFSGTMTVAFGAHGAFNYATESNGIACTHTIFGDPLNGTQKACYIEAAPPTPTIWTRCADETATCSFEGTMTVAFGASGAYKYATKTNGTTCTVDTFGDPFYATAKSCYLISPPTGAATWNVCAAENSTCSFTGRREVAYGANGQYFYGSFSNGTTCTNDIFGDPALNTAKTCYYQ